MPPLYVVLHLALAGALGAAGYRLAGRPGSPMPKFFFGLMVVALVAAGFLAERRPAWMAAVTATGWPDVVFFTNLSLEGIAVILGLMWRQAQDRGGGAAIGSGQRS